MSGFSRWCPADAFSPRAKNQPMNSVVCKKQHINAKCNFAPPKAGFIFKIKAEGGGYVNIFNRVCLVFP